MKILKLIKLLSKAAEGKKSIAEGAVGSDSFGFIFRDIAFIKDFFDLSYVSQLCNVGTMRMFLHNFSGDPDAFFKYSDLSFDISCIGSLKTLVPTIKFGMDDLLFEVWMLVRTPKGEIFPASFYYGKSRLAIGGWNINTIDLFHNIKFSLPKELNEYINVNPFDFTVEERDHLASSLEFALQGVNSSDFEVTFRDEYGDIFLAIQEGIPVFKRISDDEYWPIEIIDQGSWKYLDLFEELIKDQLTLDDKNRLEADLTSLEFRTLRRKLIMKCYDKLIDLAYQQGSRLAFQVLGKLLLNEEIKISDDLRRLILDNSRWIDERDKLKIKKDRCKRRNNLINFRTKLLKNKEDMIGQ